MEADVVHARHDIPDPRDISHGPAQTAAAALDLDLVVLIDKVDGTIADRERGDLPAVLDQLHADAFPDRRVGLLGLDTDFLEHDTPRLWSAFQRIRLHIE